METRTGFWLRGKTDYIMNYYQHIIEGCIELEDIMSNHEERAKVSMFRHFIALMGENHFNTAFAYYFYGKSDFDSGWYDFHKSMRQTDFYDVGEGHLDMLFWQFIHSSDIPYRLMKTFKEKIEIGVVGEFDNDLDGTKGWDKFGLFRALRGIK